MQDRWIPRLLTAALTLGLTAPAPAQNPPQCPQPTSNKNTVIVDLATGNVSGEREFPARKVVEVYFLNANPFFFEYKFENKTIVTEETGLAAFLKAFAPTAPSAPAQDQPEQAEVPAAAAARTPTPATITCDVAGTIADEKVSEGATALQQRHAKVQAALKSLADQIEKGKLKLQAELTSLRAETSCQGIVRSAGIIAARALDYQAGIQAVKTERTALENAIIDQEARIDSVKEKLFTACSYSTVRREIEKLDRHLDSYRTFLETSGKDLEKADEAIASQQKVIDGARATLAKPDLFYYHQTIQGPDGSGSVTIKTFRKEIGAKDFPTTPHVELELRFGGRQRFTLAAGAAFSSLESLEYDSVQAFALDPNGDLILDMNGKPMLTSTVGRVDGSDHRIVPMFALHTRLGKSDPFWIVSGVHLTFGLTAKIDTTTDVEYLLGVSFSLAEERAFLTLGAYNGVLERLRPGFFEGQALPEDLGDIPVQTEREWDFVVAFSWRLN
ncbi:MAG: hypothetical protein HC897_18710 [Thermoanaerobaculia bacterium]|nr:hypothetical protein [Thermoanaerobaculia bacterium]